MMRTTKRWAVSGGCLFLGLMFFGALSASAAPGEVTETIGTVEIGRGTPPSFVIAKVGDAVHPGDVIRTGRGGRLELRLETGTVRLYGDSLLRIPADTTLGQRVEMERGRSIFDVIKKSVRDRFEVDTPEVVVSVKGTRFEVDLAGDLASVAVFRGTVGVRAPEASLEVETLVREGFAAIGASDVPFELDLSPRVDPWDSWATLGAGRETAMNRSRSERRDQLQAAALASARRSSARELVGIASKRNPEVARRIHDIRKERATRKAGEMVEQAPAAPADRGFSKERQGGGAGEGALAFGGPAEGKANKLQMEMDAREIAKQLDRSRDLEKAENRMKKGAGSVHVNNSGGGAGAGPGAGGWNPMPELSGFELLSIGLEMSIEDIVDMWQTAIEEIQIEQPSVFDDPNPAAYGSLIRDRFLEAGLSDSAANALADYIVSQIDD